MKLSFDFLGQILGKVRRRLAEQKAREDAQFFLDAAKPRLTSLLLQAVEEMATDPRTAEGNLAGSAQLKIGEALSAAHLAGMVSPAAQAAVQEAVAQGLAKISVTSSLAAFQPLAQRVVMDAVKKIKL